MTTGTWPLILEYNSLPLSGFVSEWPIEGSTVQLGHFEPQLRGPPNRD
jgi:hypothetical protein